ncbi:hypothetical protein MarSH_402 [Marseillevirus Shanghai 1]|nr:hypothetical protein MarSH_402 [Marseillevirus Shanghai 1]
MENKDISAFAHYLKALRPELLRHKETSFRPQGSKRLERSPLGFERKLKTLPYRNENGKMMNLSDGHDTSDCLSCERDLKRPFESLDEVD